MKKLITTCVVATVLHTAHAVENLSVAGDGGAVTELLDMELGNFEVWMGIPHSSVKGLPEGTFQSDKVTQGVPMGLDADVKNVFSMIEQAGQPVLHVSGEIYGALTTKKEYGNYHLSLWHKWGDKKWPPRETVKRDSGILYHCYGEHGRFWNVWKTCLEYQVQETDLGDFIPLGGNAATPKVPGPQAEIRGDFDDKKEKRFDPASEVYSSKLGYVHACSEHDAPHGEWNHLELYVVGNDAVHVVNGHVVMVVENARKPDGSPLVKGQIQLQSEAAECYYKDIVLTPIRGFPAGIREKVRLKE
ncbi:hypothetical protein PDESU_01358 [Pontiella desulfatans]|uniref:3-keto-alpha-glucoside-1,2-lyase/3-keto-2-hydroxy-glucal hydratase domain-containing protein n=1 Tax=Pontiella desulfatans TaxID=2750659 RepID=A0A6C2TZB2_PONDE|nr:DUF1080 domain-containing protein [Pontiella desulfatans]VGO12804.1 hypothetical protein PDESU_01358 [Pontiella desulfatans]